MTDIVERLRNWLNMPQQDQHETALEAAAEIDRLRADNERLRAALRRVEGLLDSTDAALSIAIREAKKAQGDE